MVIQNVKGRFCASFCKTSFFENGKVLKNIDCLGENRPFAKVQNPNAPPLPAAAAAAAVCVVGVRFVHVCVRVLGPC